MPLRKGKSKATVSKNIEEFHTGRTYAHTAAKFGKDKANKQAIAVALSTARKSGRRYARGGSIDDFDPTEGGQIPKALQFKMQKAPDTWTKPPQRYADGGALDWSGVGEAMPEYIGRNKIIDPVANAAIGAATMYPRYVQSTVDAAKTQPGSEEAHQAYGDVGQTTGELGMSMIGPKGAPSTSGVFVGPYGAMALRNAAKETGNIAAERAMVHPVVGKELEREAKEMPEWLRDPYRNSVQERRDDWARKTLEERAAKGDFRDRDVFARSGWSFTSDGKPAKEISDIGASVKEHLIEKGGKGKDAKYAYSYEHPAGDFHKIYDIPPIKQDPRAIARGARAFMEYSHPGGPIGIGVGTNPTTAVGPVTHEVQHAIQYREGWPRGETPQNVPIETIRREHFPGYRIPEYQKEAFLKADPSLKRIFAEKTPISTPDTAQAMAYLHSAGENQSFNAQNTRARSYKYLEHPADREIIPRELQDIKYFHKAGGGGVSNFNPERGAAIGLAHQGAIKSSVPGRTDKLQLNVLAGSSVAPADVISALGQGNSDAGHSIFAKLITKGPYGMNIPKTKAGMRVGGRKSSLSALRFASGGEAPMTTIMAAGGEHIATPDQVMALGNGDLDLGHLILNKFYEHVRQRNAKTLKNLPGPKNG